MAFSREVIKSSKKIRRKKTFENFSILFFVAVFLFVSWGYFFQNNELLIESIVVDGNASINTGDIFNFINLKLSERYVFLFPGSNIFIYPKNEIISGLFNKFLKIEDLKISYNGFNKIIFTVKERKPAFVLCEHPQISADTSGGSDKCFYADKDGLVYEPAPNFSEGVFLVFREDERVGGILGKNILPRDKFKKIIQFKDEISRIAKDKIPSLSKISEIKILDFGDFEIVLASETPDKPKLLFSTESGDVLVSSRANTASVLNVGEKNTANFQNIDRVLSDEARNFDAVLRSPVFIGGFNKKGNFLEYIDLRFGKKVFYKFKTQ